MSHLPTPSLPSSPAAPSPRSASLASMKATRRAEWGTIDWRFRYGVPLLVPTAFFVLFALSGLVARDEPKQVADAKPGVELMADEVAAGPVALSSAPSERTPALRDAAVIVHEALDPVGTGRNTTP